MQPQTSAGSAGSGAGEILCCAAGSSVSGHLLPQAGFQATIETRGTLTGLQCRKEGELLATAQSMAHTTENTNQSDLTGKGRENHEISQALELGRSSAFPRRYTPDRTNEGDALEYVSFPAPSLQPTQHIGVDVTHRRRTFACLGRMNTL